MVFVIGTRPRRSMSRIIKAPFVPCSNGARRNHKEGSMQKEIISERALIIFLGSEFVFFPVLLVVLAVYFVFAR
jgi:hypothetical protein